MVTLINRLRSIVGLRALPSTDSDASLGYYDGFGLEDEQFSNARAYEVVPSVYRAVDVIKNAIASLDLRFYQGDGVPENSTELSDEHPWVDSWNEAETIEEDLSASLDINGNAYLYAEPKKQKRYNFTVPPAHRISPVTDRKTGELVAWEYRTGGRPIRLDVDDVLHRKYYSVRGTILGLSPLSPAGLSWRIQRIEQRWVHALFSRGGEGSGWLTSESVVTESKLRRFNLMLRQRHQGPEGAGRALVMPRGVKREMTMLTPEQLQFVDQYKLTKGDVYEVYGVPPWMVGIKDGGGLGDAGSKTDERIFWLHTVMSRTTRLERGITKFMRKKLGSEFFCVFDFSGVPVIKQIEIEIAKEAKAATGRPAMSVNEYRQRFLGLPPLDGEEFDKPGSGTPEFSIGGLQNNNNQDGAASRRRTQRGDLGTGTSDPRAESRRRHDAALTRYEMRMLSLLRAMFDAQEKRMIANVSSNRIVEHTRAVDFNFTEDEADDFLRELMRLVSARGTEVLEDLGANAVDLIGKPRIRAFVERHGIDALTQLTETTRAELESALAEVAGGSAAERREVIERVFDSRRDDALMIARTETAGFFNYATTQAWEESGVVEARTWITTMDGHARPEHEDADGQTVAIDEPFIVGGERARFPGDPALSPGNRINCRCGIEAVVSERHRLRHIKRWMENGHAKTGADGDVHVREV